MSNTSLLYIVDKSYILIESDQIMTCRVNSLIWNCVWWLSLLGIILLFWVDSYVKIKYKLYEIVIYYISPPLCMYDMYCYHCTWYTSKWFCNFNKNTTLKGIYIVKMWFFG